VGTINIPVRAAPTSILISQVYGGGGNAGATYTNDFIELFNPTNTTISIAGWSIQYAGTTGTTWLVTPLTNVSIAPGQYYLIQEAAGAGGTTGLPTPDATGTIAMAATAGKVALVNTITPLSGSCPLAGVVDFVGYGAGTDCSEGTVVSPAPSNTTSAIRSANGCTDADNNSTDFSTGAPTPRNTISPINICPPPTATPVPVIEVVINEVAWAGTRAFSGDEWIELYNATGAPIALTNWRLEAADGDPIINLSAYIIPATGFLLLERGSANVTNVPVSASVNIATYFSGLLSNSGETLYLINGSSQIVDTANSNGGGWPAGGVSTPFPSMERNGVVTDSDF
jgi:hypothetical protein